MKQTSMVIVIFGLTVFSIFFLSGGTRYFIERSVSHRSMLFLFFPGVVLHEIFHAIASSLVGARIHRIRFFSSTGGSVVHEKPRLPFGQILISFSPFLGGIILMIFVGGRIFEAAPGVGLSHILRNFLRDFSNNLFSPWFWVWLYILYSVSATMLPSWQDVRNSLVAFVAIGVLAAIFIWSGVYAPRGGIIKEMTTVLSSALAPLAAFFTFSAIFYFVRRVLR